jgi:hypothetical protein
MGAVFDVLVGGDNCIQKSRRPENRKTCHEDPVAIE